MITKKLSFDGKKNHELHFKYFGKHKLHTMKVDTAVQQGNEKYNANNVKRND